MLIQGDARHIALEDESVQCVVTSPPYWGLRDYGLPPSIWDAREGCEHVWGEESTKTQSSQRNAPGGIWKDDRDWDSRKGYAFTASQGAFCRHCFAWRGTLGLEPTWEKYVAHLVEVFREVRRVLRKDGTVFLNLGDSYYGAGYSNNKNTGGASRAQGGKQRHTYAQRGGVYDTSCKALGDYQEHGCLCENLCGVCRVAYQSRKSHSDGLLVAMLAASLSEPNRECMESERGHPPTLDFEPQKSHNAYATQDQERSPSPGRGRLRASLESMLGESSPQLLAACLQRASHDECLLCGHSLAGYAQASEDRGACTCDIERQSGALGHRILGKSSLDLAYPDYTTTSRNEQLKPKDLCGIPWAVAFALRADGWYLRSDIIWHKPNPMPESVTDRPTKSHEYLFLLTKNAQYFYDAEAVREQALQPIGAAKASGNCTEKARRQGGARTNTGRTSVLGSNQGALGRNRRSVWTIPTAGFAGAHFATFPPALVEPCILAGTSARGACPACESAWERVVERGLGMPPQFAGKDIPDTTRIDDVRKINSQIWRQWKVNHPDRYVGWRPTCSCDAGDPVPCVVLDPFCGTGTVGEVAIQHRRRFVGLDLSRPYLVELATERLAQVNCTTVRVGREKRHVQLGLEEVG